MMETVHSTRFDNMSLSYLHYPCERFTSPSLRTRLQTGVPTWGTCAPSGTFAYLKGYI